MQLPWLDYLGNWNPQLLRELKGRLKNRNVIITATISLLGQFILFQYFQIQLPVAPSDEKYTYPINHRYCTGKPSVREYLCLKDASGHFLINWQVWWQDLFVALSLIGVFVLLVAGTYMLINDLAQEERRGTLNFIRLTPQSTQNLLTGKILGVPILFYIGTAIAVPLHVGSGLSAHIPFGHILGYYTVVFACSIFFYSAALLYALVSNWLAGFQAWLGSGIVLGFLWLDTSLISVPINSPIAWFRLLSPFDLIPHLTNSSFYGSNQQALEKLQWFNLSIGGNLFIIYSIAVLNFCLWTYWIWQGLQRCFRNPNATFLSKRQSYLLTACFEGTLLGFAVPGYTNRYLSANDWLFQHLIFLCALNLLLFLLLIAALSPHRQVLNDWARYRHHNISTRKRFWGSSLVKDLIWGEKSPALIAIAINLVIAITPLAGWMLLSKADAEAKTAALLALTLSASLVMLYAAAAQFVLFMRTQHRVLWAIGVLGAVILLPPVILGILSIQPAKSFGFLWLFSVAAPLIPLSEKSLQMTIFLSSLGQWSLLVLMSVQLSRQLRKAGESSSKALLTTRQS